VQRVEPVRLAVLVDVEGAEAIAENEPDVGARIIAPPSRDLLGARR
jgi:hypothetical protein